MKILKQIRVYFLMRIATREVVDYRYLSCVRLMLFACVFLIGTKYVASASFDGHFFICNVRAMEKP